MLSSQVSCRAPRALAGPYSDEAATWQSAKPPARAAVSNAATRQAISFSSPATATATACGGRPDRSTFSAVSSIFSICIPQPSNICMG